jgi:hypothetical protein
LVTGPVSLGVFIFQEAQDSFSVSMEGVGYPFPCSKAGSGSRFRRQHNPRDLGLSRRQFQYRSKALTLYVHLQALFVLPLLTLGRCIQFPPSFCATSLRQAPSKGIRQ